MPILDVSEQNNSLDNDYGSTKGPNAPANHELVMYDGDPRDGGVELNDTDCPGYERVTVANDSGWPAAVDGRKTRTITMPVPTDAWDQTATHWGLENTTTNGVGDFGRFADPIVVTGAGTISPAAVIIQYGNLD